MKLTAIYRNSLLVASLSVAPCFSATPAMGAGDIPSTTSTPTLSRDVIGFNSQTPDALNRVRAASEELYSDLQSFVCNEQMERFRGSINGAKAHHVDTLTTKISFESGVESYSDVRQNERSRPSISSVSGAWSEGEFGTLLQQTQTLLNTQAVVFKSDSQVDGSAAAIYEVQIAAQDSPWDLVVDNQHYRIPFRTEVWISKTTGQILRIVRTSSSIPSKVGISEIQWGVTLRQVQINDRSWLLPNTGSYAVLYTASNRREWNELTFSGYHRYGAETALRFQ